MMEQEPEQTFIIQNRTPSPHYVSDIKLSFDPLQVIDLTWEDPKLVKASKDLKNSLRKGILVQITSDAWDSILSREAEREKKEILRQKKNSGYETMEIDGKTIEVESLDAEKPYNKDGTVSISGYANDSLTYALALDIAQHQAEMQGDELSVEQFAAMVKSDPTIVQRLVKSTSVSVSGDIRKGSAVVASQDSDGNVSPRKMNMSNLNKDGYIAGGDFEYKTIPTEDFFPDEAAIAHEIDLEADLVEGSTPSFKRQK
jgi:hypothetical protein